MDRLSHHHMRPGSSEALGAYLDEAVGGQGGGGRHDPACDARAMHQSGRGFSMTVVALPDVSWTGLVHGTHADPGRGPLHDAPAVTAADALGLQLAHQLIQRW